MKTSGASKNQTLNNCKWIYKLMNNLICDERRIFKDKLMARFSLKRNYYNKVCVEAKVICVVKNVV